MEKRKVPQLEGKVNNYFKELPGVSLNFSSDRDLNDADVECFFKPVGWTKLHVKHVAPEKNREHRIGSRSYFSWWQRNRINIQNDTRWYRNFKLFPEIPSKWPKIKNFNGTGSRQSWQIGSIGMRDGNDIFSENDAFSLTIEFNADDTPFRVILFGSGFQELVVWRTFSTDQPTTVRNSQQFLTHFYRQKNMVGS